MSHSINRIRLLQNRISALKVWRKRESYYGSGLTIDVTIGRKDDDASECGEFEVADPSICQEVIDLLIRSHEESLVFYMSELRKEQQEIALFLTEMTAF